jgi:hypothetical protein
MSILSWVFSGFSVAVQYTSVRSAVDPSRPFGSCHSRNLLFSIVSLVRCFCLLVIFIRDCLLYAVLISVLCVYFYVFFAEWMRFSAILLCLLLLVVVIASLLPIYLDCQITVALSIPICYALCSIYLS